LDFRLGAKPRASGAYGLYVSIARGRKQQRLKFKREEYMTTCFNNDYDTAAQKIIERVGKNVVIAVALGIGKPIGLLNALYKIAVADKSIQLTIITGLTLARPLLHNELEKRFIGPILERLLTDYEDPLYERDRVLQRVPDNIKVIEFFLAPGKYLHNSYVQQNYISSKYTSVIQDSLHYPVNVFAQQVAPSKTQTSQYSLSSNTDLFYEMAKRLKQAEDKKIAIVAEVNANLPFMTGDAIVKSDVFTDVIDTGNYHALFALPRDELSAQDHLIGLYTSSLIKDDGCLQIGIGKLSNAVANALIMRHKNNTVYQELLQQLAVTEKFGADIAAIGTTGIFEQGLYASTEMLSDEFLYLYNAGILKRRVYDHIGLQRLLNKRLITEKITPDYIDILAENKIIKQKLTAADIRFLRKFGIFKHDITYHSNSLVLPSGEMIAADLSLSKLKIIKECLGDHLKTGKLIHAGFFIGTKNFYRELKSLPHEELQQMDMTSIVRTNTLLGSYKLAKLQRQYARFINSVMMVTLGGGLVSDGLKDLQEVSGVGGQFDFVNMAQNLENSRSIINCRSTKKIKNKTISNIVWDYPNLTIPRYLRDIVITEYGIADCRSKTDAEVIKALLNVTDSRFQQELLKKSKVFGKLPPDYEIPKMFQNNYPSAIEPIIAKMQLQGYCKPYPFGSDLTEDEMVIERALLYLKDCSKLKLIILMALSFLSFSSDEKYKQYLLRMQLEQPKNIQEWIYKKLLQQVIGYQLQVKSK